MAAELGPGHECSGIARSADANSEASVRPVSRVGPTAVLRRWQSFGTATIRTKPRLQRPRETSRVGFGRMSRAARVSDELSAPVCGLYGGASVQKTHGIPRELGPFWVCTERTEVRGTVTSL